MRAVKCGPTLFLHSLSAPNVWCNNSFHYFNLVCLHCIARLVFVHASVTDADNILS